MKKISQYLYKKSSLTVCLASTAIMVIYASLVMSGASQTINEELSGEQKILGLLVSYDVDTALSLFKTLSTDALKEYSRLLTIWDNIFPLLYCSMYLFWISFIYKKLTISKKFFKYMNLYPLLPMIMDFIENTTEKRLLIQFIDNGVLLAGDVSLSSSITTLKWSLSIINYGIIATGIVWHVIRSINGKGIK